MYKAQLQRGEDKSAQVAAKTLQGQTHEYVTFLFVFCLEGLIDSFVCMCV